MNEDVKTCGNPSRGRYVNGCRCYMCRVANAEYAYEHSHRDRNHKAAKNPMVGKCSVSNARMRVQGWLDAGYGFNEICRATGVGRSAMRTLLYGKHDNVPRMKNGKPKVIKRMSRKNYEAIMKCSKLNGKAPNQLVDAKPARDMVNWLVGHGMSYRRIADASGIPYGTVNQIPNRSQVEHKTIVRLARVAVELKMEAMAS